MSLLANYPFFFDGPEYVALSRLPIKDALMQAHPLAHPVSIWLWRLTYSTLGESVAILSLVSLLFWTVGTLTASRWIKPERRLLFCGVCWLLPLPWLVMTNVGVDAVSAGLFAAGMGVLAGKKSWAKVVVATILFGLSIFNYLGMMVWLPIPVATVWFDQKLPWRSRLGMVGSVVTSVIIGIGALLAMGLWTKGVGVGLASIPIALYHAGVAFVANYTWVSMVIVLGFGMRWIRTRDWAKLTIAAGISSIFIISLLPWHSGPYGRLGIMGVYPLAWLYTRLPKMVGVLALLLVIPNWWGVWRAYQVTPLPILQQRLLTKSSCDDQQIILSEIQRPQLSGIYPAAWYVGPANWEEVARKIETKKEEGNGWCISQQALDFPYRQFEGQLPYPLSGSEEKRGFLSGALEKEKLAVVGEEPQHPELTIYTISR